MSPFVCVMFVTNFLNSNLKKGVKKKRGGEGFGNRLIYLFCFLNI